MGKQKIRRKIRRLASSVAGKLDVADLLWVAMLVCVVVGVWHQWGQGIGLIVAGFACGFLALALSDGRGIGGKQ